MLTEIVGYIIISLKCQVIYWELKRGVFMKLSTRGRYGLKAMYQLALHYGEGPIPLNTIGKLFRTAFFSLKKRRPAAECKGSSRWLYVSQASTTNYCRAYITHS